MPGVELDRLSKQYGTLRVVDAVDLSIAPGEFMTLLGPSGCGKTTTLRMVAGFVVPSDGRIVIGGRDVTRISPNRRNTGMVFQNFALFPHLTVTENIAFGLRVRRLDRAIAQQRVAEAIRLVRLEGMETRLPRQLSGGQQQRVALARAVVIRPEVLLLDEPLSALDLQLRQDLQTQIRHVQQTLALTTVYVTHDQGEALRMSDRISVMRNGRIVQTDSPRLLYRRPRSAFVAKFIGHANVLEATVIRSERGRHLVQLDGTDIRVEVADDGPQPSVAAMVLRPEAVTLGHELPNRMQGVVQRLAYSGSVWNATLGCGAVTLDVELPFSAEPPSVGGQMTFSWQPENCLLVPREAPEAG